MYSMCDIRGIYILTSSAAHFISTFLENWIGPRDHVQFRSGCLAARLQDVAVRHQLDDACTPDSKDIYRTTMTLFGQTAWSSLSAHHCVDASWVIAQRVSFQPYALLVRNPNGGRLPAPLATVYQD